MPAVAGPVIDSVSGLSSEPRSVMIIRGTGFGTDPELVPPSSDGSVDTVGSLTSPSLSFWDNCFNRYCGTGDSWQAGHCCNFGENAIGIYLASWSTTQIVIQGFGLAVGPCGASTTWDICTGDNLTVQVLGPDFSGEAFYNVTLGAPTPSNLAVTAFSAVPPTVGPGQPTQFVVTASGGVAPLYYLYTGLPAGCLSLDTARLSCTPTAAGNVTVQVSVSDSSGHLVLALTNLSVVAIAVPQIWAVTPVVAADNQSFWINGTGFGQDPQEVALRDGSVDTVGGTDAPSLAIADDGGGAHNWSAGHRNTTNFDSIGLGIASWTPTSIALTGFGSELGVSPGSTWAISTGDPLLFVLFGPDGSGIATSELTVGPTVPTATGPPVITSVTAVTNDTGATIEINGSNFGSAPQTVALPDGSVDTVLSSTTPSLVIADNGSGPDHWTAGESNNSTKDPIGVFLRSWSPDQIVVGGFGSNLSGASPLTHNNSGKSRIAPGDPILIDVSNPAAAGQGIFLTVATSPGISAPCGASCARVATLGTGSLAYTDRSLGEGAIRAASSGTCIDVQISCAAAVTDGFLWACTVASAGWWVGALLPATLLLLVPCGLAKGYYLPGTLTWLATGVMSVSESLPSPETSHTITPVGIGAVPEFVGASNGTAFAVPAGASEYLFVASTSGDAGGLAAENWTADATGGTAVNGGPTVIVGHAAAATAAGASTTSSALGVAALGAATALPDSVSAENGSGGNVTLRVHLVLGQGGLLVVGAQDAGGFAVGGVPTLPLLDSLYDEGGYASGAGVGYFLVWANATGDVSIVVTSGIEVGAAQAIVATLYSNATLATPSGAPPSVPSSGTPSEEVLVGVGVGAAVVVAAVAVGIARRRRRAPPIAPEAPRGPTPP